MRGVCRYTCWTSRRMGAWGKDCFFPYLISSEKGVQGMDTQRAWNEFEIIKPNILFIHKKTEEEFQKRPEFKEIFRSSALFFSFGFNLFSVYQTPPLPSLWFCELTFQIWWYLSLFMTLRKLITLKYLGQINFFRPFNFLCPSLYIINFKYILLIMFYSSPIFFLPFIPPLSYNPPPSTMPPQP